MTRWLAGPACRLAFLAAVIIRLPALLTGAGDVTLEDWVSAALERDPEIKEAQIENSWQRSRVDTREVWEDPELRIGREQREDRGDQNSIRLRIPIPNPWEARAGRREFEARADAGYLRMEAIAWEKSMELATRYFEAVFRHNLVEARTQFQEGFTRDLEAAEKGYEARVLTRDRLIDMKAEHAIASARLARNRVQWRTLVEEMRALAGWTDKPVESLATPLPVPSTLAEVPSLENLHRIAFREEGELGALTAEQREEEARLDGVRSRSIPWITFLEGTWLEERERNREDFEVRVGITLPVFSWLRHSQTEEALRVMRSRDRIKAYSDGLNAALESAWFKVQAEADRLTEVYATTAESIDEINTALAAGGIDPRRLSGLRDLWMDLQEERLEAARDYQFALLDLMSVTGPGYPVR